MPQTSVNDLTVASSVVRHNIHFAAFAPAPCGALRFRVRDKPVGRECIVGRKIDLC